MSPRAPALLIFAAVLAGCQSAGERRWAKLEEPLPKAPAKLEPSVAVSVFAAQDAKTVVTLKDFSDRGQARAIAEIMQRAPSLAEALGLLAAPLPARSDTPAEVDRTLLKRTLVVSLSDPIGQLPGDRFWKADITLTPQPQPGGETFEFAGYSIAVAEVKTLQVAKQVEKRDRNVSGEIAPKFGSGAASLLDIKGGASKSIETDSDVVQSYVPTFPDITPGKLTLHKRGERNVDVTGNVLINLSLHVQPDPRIPLLSLASKVKLSEGATPLPPDKVSLTLQALILPPSCPLKVRFKTDYMAREIRDRRDSYVEGVQSIQLRVDTTSGSDTVLLSARDVSDPVYAIVDEDKADAYVQAGAARARRILVMDSAEEARTLADWLRINGGGALRLTYHGALVPKGRVWVVQRYVVGCPVGPFPPQVE